MIINIAGTNGSGKSTVVRGLIARAKHVMTVMNPDPGSKWKELGRIVKIAGHEVFISGRYPDEFDTGGSDTIKDHLLNYAQVKHHARLGLHAVFEGSRMMNHTVGIELVRENITTIHVIRLTTTLDEVKAGIDARRVRRGDPPFSELVRAGQARWGDIEGGVVRARNFAQKLKDLGAHVHLCSRDQALPRLLTLLGADKEETP